uniref:YhdP family protein n=1 Tax=Candidatus Ruthturnera calyptogenae TaxID=386487 RepID=UPI000465838F
SFKLDSSSSTINLTGSSNIVKQTYHLEAKVLPAISDAVPITTYLAGGGLSGMVVWLVDKILFKGKLINNIVDKVVEFKYKITGSWNKPIIENISTVL